MPCIRTAIMLALPALAALALGPTRSSAQGLIHEIFPNPPVPEVRFLGAAGDMDRDGVPDVFVTSMAGGIFGRASYVASGRTGLQIGPFYWQIVRVLAIGDIDLDGAADSLTVVDWPSPGGIEARSAQGNLIYRVPGAIQVALAGDQNWDGVQDFFAAGGLYSGRDGILLRPLPLLHHLAAVGDLNGDAYNDVASMSPLFPAPQVLTVTSGRDGSSILSIQFSPQQAAAFLDELGDVDGDGVREVGLAGRVFSVRLQQLLPLNYSGRAVRAGDLNQDGCEEIVYHNAQSNVISVRGTVQLDYPAATSTWPIFAQVWGGAVGDFNRDGSPDVAISTPQGTVQIYGFVGASFRPFGSGCAGSYGMPQLAATTLPRIGERFGILASGLVPSGTAVLTLGYSNTRWGFITLPASLTPLGAPLCSVFVSGDSLQLLVANNGIANWTTSIPRDAGLLRTSIFMQCFPLDGRANGLGITASNAGEARIGG